VINAEGGVPRPLTTGPTSEARALWSPDGRWIYFGSNRTGSAQVWKVPAGGGAPVRVTRKGGWSSAISPDGKFLYYTNPPKGVWRVPVEGGDETSVLTGDTLFWVPLDRGIYFVEPSVSTRVLKFLDFGTGRVADIFRFEQPLSASALQVSRDGRWLLYAPIDQSGYDLMLVENFR